VIQVCFVSVSSKCLCSMILVWAVSSSVKFIMADKEAHVFFGGRLAEYKYYDMHQVIESALRFMSNHTV
jgi:hypothetical protein